MKTYNDTRDKQFHGETEETGTAFIVTFRSEKNIKVLEKMTFELDGQRIGPRTFRIVARPTATVSNAQGGYAEEVERMLRNQRHVLRFRRDDER